MTYNTTIFENQDRAAFQHSLDEMGVHLNGFGFEKAFARMKEAEGAFGEVSPLQLRSICDEVIAGIEVLEGVKASFA